MENRLQKLGATIICALVLFFTINLQAQEVGEIIWEDHFDDPAQDYLLNNVGWLYFGEDDGLAGQVTMQSEDGTAYLKAGNYASMIGAALILSNGVSYVDPTDMDGTEERIREQSKLIPANHEINFRVKFDAGMQDGAWFSVSTRLFTEDTSRAFPDPTEESYYSLNIDPINDGTQIIKVNQQYGLIQPAAWISVSDPTGDFDYDLGVWYWVKFYLFEGDVKVKVWDGTDDLEAGDEVDWLIETTDPDPWVQGTHMFFSLLGQVDCQIELDDVIFKQVGSTAVDGDENTLPTQFALENNYPNPFNPATSITFTAPYKAKMNLVIYNSLGQKVRTLVNSQINAGTHTEMWDGFDDAGNQAVSGIYFYKLTSDDGFSATKKMILMK